MANRATAFLVGFAMLLALRVVGQGFATAPVAWALPTGGQVVTFQGVTTDYGFNAPMPYPHAYTLTGSQKWSVTDITGDTRPDLVVLTQQQADGSFLPFGTAPNRYWKVYPGTSTGFATTATNWTLPTGGAVASYTGTAVDYGFNWLTNQVSVAVVGSQNWSVLDVNGDARPDLVVFSQVQGNNAALPFGTAPNRYWKVYLNTGSGFAPTAVNWPLPAGGRLASGGIDFGFDWLASNSNNNYYDSAGSQNWSMLDINGDAKPDLVVHSQRQPGIYSPSGIYLLFGTAPNRYWKVYLNTGSGFATAAIDWPLPVGGYIDNSLAIPIDYGFYALAHTISNSGATSSQNWSVTDINGDARPDLVVLTQMQASGTSAPFGTAPSRYWKVHLNTGSGFATAAVDWPLPVGGQVYLNNNFLIDCGFNALASTRVSYEAFGCQTWSVTDINGDARPDLVVVSQKQTPDSFLAFGTAPNRYWKVYLNTGSGFATAATNWALPTGGYVATDTGVRIDYGFNALDCFIVDQQGAGSQTWWVLDVNSDTRPDLLVLSQKQADQTSQPFGTAPSRYWNVYLNATTPLSTTPGGGLAEGVQLHPNPTASQLTFSGPTSLAGQPYTLLDVLGRPVRTGQFGTAEPTLNVQALLTGVYGVRIGTSGRILRFVKQ